MTLQVRFLVVGAVFILVLAILRYLNPGRTASKSGDWKLQLLPAAIVAVLCWGVLWLVESLFSVQFLSPGAEQNGVAETSRWSALAYFAAMVAGMVAQTLWNAIQNRKENAAPVIDKWEFLKPALVAPIVFVAVYQNIVESRITVAMLLFSFQNGFFWQTVLRKN